MYSNIGRSLLNSHHTCRAAWQLFGFMNGRCSLPKYFREVVVSRVPPYKLNNMADSLGLCKKCDLRVPPPLLLMLFHKSRLIAVSSSFSLWCSSWNPELLILTCWFTKIDSAVDFVIDKFLVKHQFHVTVLGDGKSAAVPGVSPVPWTRKYFVAPISDQSKLWKQKQRVSSMNESQLLWSLDV